MNKLLITTCPQHINQKNAREPRRTDSFLGRKLLVARELYAIGAGRVERAFQLVSLMLPKNRRISREIFKSFPGKKKFSESENFSLLYSPNSTTARFGVSVSKKVSKKAVVRNKIRRRTYSELRDLISISKPGLYLFVAKPSAKDVKGEKLKNELKKLLVVSSWL